MSEENTAPSQPDLKVVGRRIGLAIIVVLVVVAIIAIWSHDNRPQTDDATLRANFIGVAPQASGHIVELHVRDNQYVKEGDLLFVIDPRPYEIAVARAKAGLSLTHKEVDVLEKVLQLADASIVRAEAQRLAAEASVERAEAEFKEADDHVKRLEPLLVKEFATADQLEAARTRRNVANTAIREAQKLLAAAAAAVEQAKVERLRA